MDIERIVALVDMDCFFVQVEQRLNPELKGKPCAVVQYTGRGVIIAVSYEARAFGVTRGMSAQDAKAKCPDILLPKVPELRGKADLTKYREAGAEVIKIFSKFCHCVERASIDEAYFDLTKEIETKMNTLNPDILSMADQLPNTYVVGWQDDETENDASTNQMQCVRKWLKAAQSLQSEPDIKLAIGGCLVAQMRKAVYEQTGFSCSAGVSCNKMLSKLAAGLHKPNQQTILPHSSVESFFMTVPLKKVRNLGGKLGAELHEHYGVKNMSDLCQFTKEQLCHMYGRKTGLWLYALCRGYDSEPVAARQLPKSIGCSKNFQGKNALTTREKVKYWLSQLATEVEERLLKDKEDNKRIATSMVVGLRYQDPVSQNSVVSSRTVAVVQYNQHKFAADAFTILQQFNLSPPHQASWSPPVNMLSMSAGKFTEIGIIQFGGISALLRKQIKNTKVTSQISNEFKIVQKTNPKPNDKKPKEKTIQNFFSQQLPSTSTQKCKDDVSQCNVQDVLQNVTANKSLENLSCEKNKSEKTIQGFFATKQKQMNGTKKDCSLLKDFDFQTKSPSNGQTQDTHHATLNTNLKISKFFSKDCTEVESEATSCIESRIPFSKCLPGSDDISNSLNMELANSDLQNNSDDCIILSSDHEASNGDSYTAEDADSNEDIFQNTNLQKMKSLSASTILSDNPWEINQINLDDDDDDNDDSNKINEKSVNKSMNIHESAPNIHPTTIAKSNEENSSEFHPDKRDLDIYCDKETKPNVSIPIVLCNDNALTVVEKKTELSHQNSDIFQKSIFSNHCDSGNNQMSLEALDYVTCDECLKKVLVWDFEEHQDFHFAQKLQKSVNVEAKHLSNVVPSLSRTMKKRKGKTLQTTHKKKNKTEHNVQTLELFFKK